MNIKKLKKGVSYLLFLTIAVSLSMCNNTEKGAKKDVKNLKSKTENRINRETRKSENILSEAKLYYYNKIAMVKAEESLAQAKTDLMLNNDKQKAEKELNNATEYLSMVKHSTDEKYKAGVSKAEAGIQQAKSNINKNVGVSVKNIDASEENLYQSVGELESKTHYEKVKGINAYKRHYAEIKAKTFLLKARLASDKTSTYAKSEQYLSEADRQYAEAEKYGSTKYKATIEELRKDIKEADASLKSNDKKAKSKIHAIITKVEKYSVYENNTYYYIPVI